MQCTVCNASFEQNSEAATQVYRRNGIVVLAWETAQEVEDLVLPLLRWAKTHTLPKPIITITFPVCE